MFILSGFSKISLYFKLKFLINIYIYNKNYKIIFINFSNKLDNFNNISNFLTNNIIKKKKFINKYLIYNVFRVVFKGKGFRVRLFRSLNKITLNFGHSHWTKFKLLNTWRMFKLRRQNYILLAYSNKNSELFKKDISTVKIMNRYTQRGLRLKKFCIKKRFGKISQYISSLH